MSSTPIRYAITQSPTTPVNVATPANEVRPTASDSFGGTSSRESQGQDRRGPDLLQRPPRATKAPKAARPSAPPPPPKTLTMDAALKLLKDDPCFERSDAKRYLRRRSDASRAQYFDFAAKVKQATGLSVARTMRYLHQVGELFYDDFLTQLRSLGGEGLDDDDWHHLCRGLAEVPDERRASVAKTAPKLFKDMSYWIRDELLTTLGNIPLEHYVKFVDAGEKLQSHAHVETSALLGLSDSTPEKWPLLTQVAPEILKSVPSIDHCRMLKALGQLSPEQLFAVRDLLPLFSTEPTEALVSKLYALVNENFRDSLASDVARALDLCAPAKLDMTTVIQAVGRLGSEDIEIFIAFAKHIASKTQAELNSIFYAMTLVDGRRREEFSGLVEIFIKNSSNFDPSSIAGLASAAPDTWSHLSQVLPQILNRAAPQEHLEIVHILKTLPIEQLSTVRDLLPMLSTETTNSMCYDIRRLVESNFYDSLASDVDKALQQCAPAAVEMRELVEAVAEVRSDDLPGFISFAKDVAHQMQIELNDVLWVLSGVSSQHRETFYGQVEVFLKNKDLRGRAFVLECIARFPDEHREELLGMLTSCVSNEPLSTSPSGGLIQAICVVAQAYNCARAKTNLEFALQLVPMSILEANPLELLMALNQVAEDDRASFRELCQPFLAEQDPLLLLGYLSAVCRTPRDGRAAHVQDLLNRNTAGRVDTENVMDSKRIRQTRASIVALLGRFNGPIDREAQLNAIENYLTNYPLGDIPQSEKDVFFAQRGGGTERDNALRTLSAPRRYGDYSNCLRDNDAFSLGDRNMGLGDLTALINHAVDTFAPLGQNAADIAKEQGLMRYALFKALAQSIEDDGHRVCGIGLSQRLVSVLQGRYPQVQIDQALLPEQFVTQATADFAAQLKGRGPTVVELQRFYDATVRQSQGLECYGIAEVESVRSQLREYLSMDHDWQQSASDI